MQPRFYYSAHITHRTCLSSSIIIVMIWSRIIRILLYIIIIMSFETPIRRGRRREFNFDCVSYYYYHAEYFVMARES